MTSQNLITRYIKIFYFVILKTKVATKLFIYLITFGKLLLPLNAQSCNQASSGCNQLEAINLSRYKRMLPEEIQNMLPPEPFTVPVKRIHSRHRRFLAPGASWQLKVSWNEIMFMYVSKSNFHWKVNCFIKLFGNFWYE